MSLKWLGWTLGAMLVVGCLDEAGGDAHLCIGGCELGAVECVEGGVRTCAPAADGCGVWSLAVGCEVGTACDEGRCVPTCHSECAPGSARCTDTGLQLCAAGVEGCGYWGAAVACAPGSSCSAGRCEVGCTDECASAARSCGETSEGATGVRVCGQHDADACLDWGRATACDAGEGCSSGRCSLTCNDECEPGSRDCEGAGYRTCADYDDDPCTEWSDAIACAEGEACSGGRCASQCSHDCVGEVRRCAEGGVQVCGDHDDDPCADWSLATPCPDAQVCAQGACVDNCVPECEDGSLRCAVGGGVQTCGDYDPDECTEWSAAAPCLGGESCSAGLCTEDCSNECELGMSRCGDNGVQGCGNFDDDACREWGLPAACPEGQVCTLGVCADSCTDECAAGSARCHGGGLERCGDFDLDLCLEWSAATPCEADELCSGGACEVLCVPECADGTRRCAPEGVQTCGDLAVCPRWGAVLGEAFVAGGAMMCDEGTTCSDGECRAVCVDECAPDEVRCSPGGRQTCGEFDLDACRDWSDVIVCEGSESCSDGVCLVVCVDECVAEAVMCANEGATRTCGEFDDDVCLDWGLETPCADAAVCVEGACVVCVASPEVQNGVDDDCDGMVDEAVDGTAPGWCVLQWPARLTTTEGLPSGYTYGRLYAEGMTEGEGPHVGVLAQAGYGAVGTRPTDQAWIWMDASYSAQFENNDEYRVTLAPLAQGAYDVAWRFSVDGGVTWGYCDQDGSDGGEAYSVEQAGVLVVGPGVWWGNVQFPHHLGIAEGEPVPSVYGRVYQEGITPGAGQGAGILAQLGYGPDGTRPADAIADWVWVDGEFNVDAENNDEYQGTLPSPPAGEYDFAWRYSLDDGVTWTYADIDGSDNGYQPAQAGRLAVR